MVVNRLSVNTEENHLHNGPFVRLQILKYIIVSRHIFHTGADPHILFHTFQTMFGFWLNLNKTWRAVSPHQRCTVATALL